jgi:mgtE-like transporter
MFAKEMLKQSLPLLIFCGLGSIVAGRTLGEMLGILNDIPGLIVVIPAIIALRGNISTTFGSRLGSAYHLGLINSKNMWNDELKQNIIGSLILSFLISSIVGILAYVTTILFFNLNPNPFKIIIIVILAGILSSIILTTLTVFIIYIVFKRGYDPDNITGPALATFGDIITMFCIFGSAVIIEVLL